MFLGPARECYTKVPWKNGGNAPDPAWEWGERVDGWRDVFPREGRLVRPGSLNDQLEYPG